MGTRKGKQGDTLGTREGQGEDKIGTRWGLDWGQGGDKKGRG